MAKCYIKQPEPPPPPPKTVVLELTEHEAATLLGVLGATSYGTNERLGLYATYSALAEHRGQLKTCAPKAKIVEGV